MLKDSYKTTARKYAPGIGDAVADRTINRKIFRPYDEPKIVKITVPRRDDSALDGEVAAYAKMNGYRIEGYKVDHGNETDVEVSLRVIGEESLETWEDVAHRVALGNSFLVQGFGEEREFHAMHHHLRQASILMSGRHLQHGDEFQRFRNQEVFTNCSSSATSFLKYYLLLNGSGVGRAYDDAMMVVDWREMPIIECAIGYEHQDVQQGLIKPNPLRDLEHLYADSRIHVFEVPDSREGWAKAIEKIEQMASERIYRDHVLILDFNGVRPKGSPIKGMQDRPASGPGPMIDTINKIKAIRNTDMEPWRATMFVDHYLSECVLVGGARRAARMATKTWRDANVIDFINLKRGGFLWSSNNSVTVDEEFWKLVKATDDDLLFESDEAVALAKHAKEVFEQICTAAYYDETGEPGIINADRLVWNKEGIEELLDGDFAESERYKVDPETGHLMRSLAHAWKNSSTPAITNPCGEIVLNALGGYCVIADVVPYHAGSAGQSTSSQWWDEEVAAQEWDHDAEDAFRTATRALIRVNTMDSLYSKEVKRTNRIGVGITGLHEYAWSRFEYGWHDLIDEEKSKDFWLTLSRFKRAVVDEAKKYSTVLGLKIPHTNTTIKPAGCASLDTAIKTTEGALTMRELFAKHGVTEDDLRGMEDGTWIEPKIKTLVLDEGNVEREVTKLYLNGVKPVYEIEFEDGTVVKLTGNHKLKTVAGEWKRVDELTDTDEILQF